MAVSNVMMYVCDALRWDELPTEIAEQGVAFKTVAQSTWSPPCFTTLSTGLHPEQHGVLKFSHELADGVRTIYDIDGLDGAYYNKHPNDRLADVYGVEQDRPLEELEEPFFYLERDLTTHAPYDRYEPTDPGAYFEDVDGDPDRLLADYRDGVAKSQELFEERVETLRERGVLEDTLVIFTADHGELLGELGDVGHSNPVAPEIAYVPTVFLNPSVSESDFAVDTDSEVVEQVDVVETALSMIGFDDIRTDGVDLRSERRDDSLGYSYVQVEKNGVPFYEARSAWDYDGGYVFPTNSKVARVAYFLYRQLRSTSRHVIRNEWRTVLDQYVHDQYRHGDPAASAADAEAFVDRKRDSFEAVDPTEIALSDEAEEHLEDMGYLT